MSEKIDLRAATKVDWFVKPINESNYPGDTNIQLGCLMRIADATEKMAGNYTKLQADLEMYKRWYTEEEKQVAKLKRANAALRGHINRMKKK